MESSPETLPLDGSEPAEVAIPRLLEAQGGKLFTLALRFCGDRHQAEDLVQETFLQAFRKWPQFRGDSNPGTWLCTIASRICQRLHRKKSGEPDRMASLSELLPFSGSQMSVVPVVDEDPLALEIRREGRERIEEAIVLLPTKFRLPLVLCEIAGLPMKEVAGVLGLKEATVKTRLHRARLRLRRALEDALPKTDGPPPAYSKRVCLDLLQAKQEALDHGTAFPVRNEVVCERCKSVFATMDLTRDICREMGRGELPGLLRAALLANMSDEERQADT